MVTLSKAIRRRPRLVLGSEMMDLAVYRHQGPADGDAALLHVDILPAQAKDLAAPTTAHGKEAPHRVETVVAHTA